MKTPREFFSYARRAADLLKSNGVTLTSSDGVLIAFSGGADSVFLLHVLLSLRERIGFQLSALHIEHGIRGEESLRDADFCRRVLSDCGVPCKVVPVDVPATCRETHESIETAARRLRYQALEKELADCPALTYVATAHNRDDAAETVLFRLLRGCGTEGASGIPCVRGRIIRPILDVSSREIRELLTSNGIPFVCDSTNADPAYARNYLRREILPRLAHLTPDPGKMLYECSLRFREDEGYLSELADRVPVVDRSKRSALRELPDPILKRVLRTLFASFSSEMPESVHIGEAVAQIRKEGDGAVSFPAGIEFVALGDSVFFRREEEGPDLSAVWVEGKETRIGFSGDTLLTERPSDTSAISSFLNVYNLSKKVILSSAKIVGKVSVRPPLSGDRIVYGGKTHEVRKVLTSHKVPRELRGRYPILSDESGILWIPGCAVRDGCDGRGLSPSEITLFSISGGVSDAVPEYKGSQTTI